MKLLEALDNFLHTCYTRSKASGHGFYKSVILKAVEDPPFRERLLREPAAVLREAGIVLPEGLKVTFVENTRDVVHIVVPPYIGQ
jgi:hypothetical protein